MFTTFLKYKLEEAGKLLVKIGKWFPSSKTCSACGNIKDKLELSERAWTCVACNVEHDRDYNAALNIRAEGIKVLQRTLGTRGIACECLGR